MKRRKLWNITLTILLLICLVAAGGFALVKSGDAPQNPMDQKDVSYSRQYELKGDTLSVSAKAAKNIKKDQKKRTEKKTQTKKNEEKKNEDQTGQGSSADGSRNNGKSDTKRRTDPGADTGNPDDKKSDINNHPSDQPEKKDPKQEETTEVYFTTSIRDKETVTAYQYDFTITHLHPELNVDAVNVTVNGETVPNFSGSVLLKEGSNQITVSVSYSADSGKVIQAEKTYTVFVDTATLVISTDLKEQNADSPYLDFHAEAKYKNEKAPIQVYCNGSSLTGTDGDYTATLKAGSNEIKLTASKGKYTVTKTYRIMFLADKNLSLYTNLKDQTVREEAFSFRVQMLNGTPKARLTVVANGEILTGEGDLYRLDLKTGNNTIRLKATDSQGVSVNRTFTVKYVPKATKETEPVLKYINVSDGMEINGETFTLNIRAEDYQGNPIYYDGMTVKLNDKKIQYRWSSDNVSYQLKLKTGKNSLDVRLTDQDGRYKDFSYELKCTYIEKGTKIGEATVSVDAKVLHLGMLIHSKKADIGYGDTVADIVDKVLKAEGYSYESSGSLSSGFYLSAINRSGITRGWSIDDGLLKEIEEDGLQLNRDPDTDQFIYSKNSLGQLDFCQGSGWMYSVNGKYLSYGMSDYKPKDGDEIRIRYTLSYGKDINAYRAAGGSHGIKDSYQHTY